VRVVAVAIWYLEHGSAYGGGWFAMWFASVGVFAAGCIACWAADAIAGPTNPTPPMYPPVRFG
jgi:hypothetical protein